MLKCVQKNRNYWKKKILSSERSRNRNFVTNLLLRQLYQKLKIHWKATLFHDLFGLFGMLLVVSFHLTHSSVKLTYIIQFHGKMSPFSLSNFSDFNSSRSLSVVYYFSFAFWWTVESERSHINFQVWFQLREKKSFISHFLSQLRSFERLKKNPFFCFQKTTEKQSTISYNFQFTHPKKYYKNSHEKWKIHSQTIKRNKRGVKVKRNFLEVSSWCTWWKKYKQCQRFVMISMKAKSLLSCFQFK